MSPAVLSVCDAGYRKGALKKLGGGGGGSKTLYTSKATGGGLLKIEPLARGDYQNFKLRVSSVDSGDKSTVLNVYIYTR